MAVKPVVLALTRSGEDVAHRVAGELGAAVHGRQGRVEKADAFFANALDHARDLFAAGVPIIGICASGILIRAVAPLLVDKRSEPPVISVSDDGAVVVPLLGGHRGANRLARQIAEALGGAAAVTTAGDVALGVALDEPPPGYRLANPADAKSVMAAMLAGQKPVIVGENIWSLVRGDGPARIVVSEAPVRTGPDVLVYHPQKYILGLGCARGCDPAEMWDLVEDVLAEADIAPGAVAGVASIDLKADERAMIATAARLGVPFRLFTAAELEAQADRLATPSEVVFAEVGCHGVAEGAALAAAGDAGELMIPKEKTAGATCAVVRCDAPVVALRGRPRGRLSVVGIGPGQGAWRTPEASRLISEADELVGYGLYLDLLGPIAVGKERADFPLGGEQDRCRYALERAGDGRNVALISSGDAGIYAMAALVFELLEAGPDNGVSDAARRVEVICAPGISAMQAAAARAGAPLGHDFCAISLSDLLTPRADILRRVRAAGEGDFVIALYNPVSKTRRTLLGEARDILLGHRDANTPVLLASNLGRDQENVRYRRLKDLRVDEVDMLTLVLVGSSNTKLAQLGEGPRMYTPRGYATRSDGELADAP